MIYVLTTTLAKARNLSATPDGSRNRAEWLSVVNFLATQNLRQVLQARAQAAAARGPACGDASAAGEARTLPVGNHGEIVAKGVIA